MKILLEPIISGGFDLQTDKNWRKINDSRTIGSALYIVDPKSESRSWDIFSRSTLGVDHFL